MQLRTVSVALVLSAILFGCGSADSAESSAGVDPAAKEPVNTQAARCEQASGAPRTFETKADFVAATNGRWVYCSGHRTFDDGVVGFEIVAGEEYFLLRADLSGNVIRGSQASDRGRVTVSATDTSFTIALDTNGAAATLTTSPKRLTLAFQAGDAEYAASP
ncbi:MAG: hypothetical protein ABIP39_13840 [Polyangiaceae bacterium]